MGLRKLVRSGVLALAVALTATAAPNPPAAPVPAPQTPVVDASQAPAVALAHCAARLQQAIQKRDPEAIQAAQLEVEILRRAYISLDVTPLAEAMAVWARAQGLAGHPDLGLAALQAVDRWAPDHPSLLGTRITLMRQQGLSGWFWSFPDLLRLTRLRLDHPGHRWLWLIQHLGMLRLAASLLLWGWAATMGLRYRNVLRHLWEEGLERKGIGPVPAAVVGAVILTLPVLVGLDPLVAAVLWLFLLAPFLTTTEVKATVLILLLQLVHPALSVLEPWATREPEPSLVMLQLQPQVQAVPPATLRFLPEEDRSFLTGWNQLQRRDWKDAEATFQGLLGRMPEQAEVLNNLGVAKFQMGDTVGAEQAFEAASKAAPRMEAYLNQSILAFARLDTDAGAAKREAAQAADPGAYARLIELNDAQRDVRTYPIPLPDTPARVEALAKGIGMRLGAESLRMDAPAFIVGLLFPILGLIAFLARVRASIRMAHPTQCIRCGEPFHTTDSPDTEVCPKCHHLFVLRDGLHAENRRRKLDEVAAHQNATRWIHKALVVLLPGCDLIFLGDTREGLEEFLLICLALGMVLATGRSVRYPGEILADPTSTWLAVGAAFTVLLFARSWFKLVPRRG
jgi:tetratricopeptide (TPR) repeat protein